MKQVKKRKKETRPRIKDNEDFVQRVKELVGNEYTFLEPYIDSSTKIKVRHNVCGHTYDVRPNNFLNGNRCNNPSCRRKRFAQVKRLKNETFIKRVQNAVGDSYIFLTSYKKSRTKLAYYHVDCGQIHYISPNNFNNGQRCRSCSMVAKGIRERKKTKMRFLAKIKGKYKLLSKYVDVTTPVTLLHLKCNREWTVIPERVLQGSRCSKCYGSDLKTTEEFKQEVYNLVGNEYTVASPYVYNIEKINIIHNKCGYKDWWVTPSNFLKGRRCPKCQESHGEQMVRSILNKLKIEFVSQKRFSDCRYKQPLPFDFYLPKFRVAIEYDGEQHYKEIAYFSEDGGLKCRKIRDHIKNQYCKKHKIDLIRIPYTITNKDEIEQIIIKGIGK